MRKQRRQQLQLPQQRVSSSSTYSPINMVVVTNNSSSRVVHREAGCSHRLPGARDRDRLVAVLAVLSPAAPTAERVHLLRCMMLQLRTP
jgi:hypothetical protein